MNFNDFSGCGIRRPIHPIALLSVLLLIGLGANALSAGQETEADSNVPGEPDQAESRYLSRSERPVTEPPAVEALPGSEQATPVTGEVPGDLLDAILADLMELKNIRREEIIVIRSEAVIWPDGSLGCAQGREMVTHAPVKGYWVVLRWAQTEFDYRASDKGMFRRCENSLETNHPVG